MQEKEEVSVTTRKTLLAAVGVRVLLIGHSVMAAWRVTLAHDDPWYWFFTFTNILIVIEGIIVIKRNGGFEWQWWCPCFLMYLITTLPSLWLLQLDQYERTTSLNVAPKAQTQSGTQVNTTMTTTTTTTTEATTTTAASLTLKSMFDEILNLADTTWIVVLHEFLIYLIVFGRWVLPRLTLSRMALSDLLFEYLAKASDIMELYALFDVPLIMSNFEYTNLILIVWSISFLQFIPVLINKHMYRTLHSNHLPCIKRACGDHFAEMFDAIATFFLQDGPFLCVRLYLVIQLNYISYSIVFFILKNILTIMLLFYRVVVLSRKIPCCSCKQSQFHHDDVTSQQEMGEGKLKSNEAGGHINPLGAEVKSPNDNDQPMYEERYQRGVIDTRFKARHGSRHVDPHRRSYGRPYYMETDMVHDPYHPGYNAHDRFRR